MAVGPENEGAQCGDCLAGSAMHCSDVGQNSGMWIECHPSPHVHIINQSKKATGWNHRKTSAKETHRRMTENVSTADQRSDRVDSQSSSEPVGHPKRQ